MTVSFRLGPEERPGIGRGLDLVDTAGERIDLPELVLAALGHVEPLAVGAHPHSVGPPGVEVTSANFERGGIDGDHAGLGESKEGPAVRRYGGPADARSLRLRAGNQAR